MTTYAVGDIHGHLDKLDRALALIEADGGTEAQIVFVGDYIDRGPDSRAVIDRLIAGLDAGRNWTCLKGNHDRMMEWFLEEPAPRHDPYLLIGYHWFHERLGGVSTLNAYGIEVPDRVRMADLARTARPLIPAAHLDFLKMLKLSHQTPDAFFAHAGIRPGVALSDQAEDDLLWIREGFLEVTDPHPALIVHGHTAIKTPTHHGNRINLDGGAAYGRPLVPVALEDGRAFTLGDDGRSELPIVPLG